MVSFFLFSFLCFYLLDPLCHYPEQRRKKQERSNPDINSVSENSKKAKPAKEITDNKQWNKMMTTDAQKLKQAKKTKKTTSPVQSKKQQASSYESDLSRAFEVADRMDKENEAKEDRLRERNLEKLNKEALARAQAAKKAQKANPQPAAKQQPKPKKQSKPKKGKQQRKGTPAKKGSNNMTKYIVAGVAVAAIAAAGAVWNFAN
jgi:hypothetical protein